MPSERFTKARRVRRRGEFQRVFDLSLRMKGRYLTVLMAPNAAGTRRLGIVASRKLGDAVRRNRAKRLIRDIFRRRIATAASSSGYDLVVIPRRELFDAAYRQPRTAIFAVAVKRCAARCPAPPSRCLAAELCRSRSESRLPLLRAYKIAVLADVCGFLPVRAVVLGLRGARRSRGTESFAGPSWRHAGWRAAIRSARHGLDPVPDAPRRVQITTT